MRSLTALAVLLSVVAVQCLPRPLLSGGLTGLVKNLLDGTKTITVTKHGITAENERVTTKSIVDESYDENATYTKDGDSYESGSESKSYERDAITHTEKVKDKLTLGLGGLGLSQTRSIKAEKNSIDAKSNKNFENISDEDSSLTTDSETNEYNELTEKYNEETTKAIGLGLGGLKKFKTSDKSYESDEVALESGKSKTVAKQNSGDYEKVIESSYDNADSQSSLVQERTDDTESYDLVDTTRVLLGENVEGQESSSHEIYMEENVQSDREASESINETLNVAS